nr:hypothetical protein [Allomuricauda sp.]
MKIPNDLRFWHNRIFTFLMIIGLSLVVYSCSEDEGEQPNEMAEENNNDPNGDNSGTPSGNNGGQSSGCPNSVGFLFEESNGLISIEFENNNFPDGWTLRNDASDTSGDGYMQWDGSASMGNPGNGMVVFPIRITSTGTYRFLWHSSFREGNDGTEHNDSWLRFPDADDFFGRNNDGSLVYPEGSGKEPNPNGASSDGWFKIYRSGDDNSFKWQASTSDHDAHNIFVTFSNEGTYLMEISARSTSHGIDRLLLFREDISQNDAIESADTFSTRVTCN